MNANQVRVLLIEDDEEDFLITQDVMEDIPGRRYQLFWAPGYEEGLKAIQQQTHDVYLVDYRLGQENGLQLVNVARNMERSGPIILLTGSDDFQLDLEAMKMGAADFLVKGQITPHVLDRSLRYSLQLNETLGQLRRSQRLLKEAQEVASLGHFERLMNPDQINWSDEHYRIFGLEPQAMPITQQLYLQYVDPRDVNRLLAIFGRLSPNENLLEIEYYINTADGKRKCLIGRIRGQFDESGQLIRIHGTTQDITEQRERENRLNVLRSAIENATIPIAWADMEGTLVFVNEAFMRFWGIADTKALVGNNFDDLMQHSNWLKNGRAQLMQHGKWSGEEVVQLNSGQKVHIFLSTNLVHDNHQQPVNMLVSLVDISQIKEQELQIAREKENAQTYLEMAGSLIIVIERDEKVKLVNREGSRLLGYEEKEIVDKNWFDHFIPPAEREEVRGVFHKVLNGEMAHVEFYENRILNQQGEPRLIRWYNRVLRREDGSIIGSISSGVDITEQKKAEQLLKNYAQQLEEDVRIQTEQLSLSEAKLTEASKMAKTGYWELDLRGESPVANFSKEYCQLYEVAEGANQGDPRYFLQFVNEADRQEVQELARKGMATGENQQFDFQITTARGNEKYLRAQLNCIKNEQGKVVRTFSVVQDITDQKLAAIQLETALASERELGQLKSRFVSMASHEFRTPLSSIMSSVSLIEMYTEKGIHDKNLKHIRRIQSSVNNLTTILNDFLSLEKLESGKVQVKTEQVDIGDFIEELQEGLG
ncbi:MAG: PAS domain S-box protein, partial [Bacteroidota bacterium]